jgi:hypothetical protein
LLLDNETGRALGKALIPQDLPTRVRVSANQARTEGLDEGEFKVVEYPPSRSFCIALFRRSSSEAEASAEMTALVEI